MIKKNLISVAILWALAALLVVLQLSLSSCKFERDLQKSKTDTTKVSKDDSTHLKKSGSGSETDLEWFRNTWVYPKLGKDTIVNNITPEIRTYNNTLPVVYIQEGGKVQQSTWQYNIDSAFRAKMDSVNAVTSVKQTHSEGGVPSFWQLIGIALAGPVFFKLLDKLTSFKIKLEKRETGNR
jgi:hypothetical protein